ncbi:hypothetical protein PsorP6_011380 [Peronosclerospora sorghi]|uniref:Uncharacterized protein n=1 Tax=Peronosclerospora sorghi TaxID=230839 RepID=A0ACC0WKF8_9STRA|nr:hypothetical protein PsorP6_011380 [Peronosclerospora sorghi]
MTVADLLFSLARDLIPSGPSLLLGQRFECALLPVVRVSIVHRNVRDYPAASERVRVQKRAICLAKMV